MSEARERRGPEPPADGDSAVALRANHGTVLLRVFLAVSLALVGAVTGVAAVALHRTWWGLILAAVVLAVVLIALPGAWWSRLAMAVGFTAVLGLVIAGRPEGDYLIASDGYGYTILGIGMVVLAWALGTVRESPHVSARVGAEP